MRIVLRNFLLEMFFVSVLSCLCLVPSADANTTQGWGLGWRTVPLPAIQSSTSSVAGVRRYLKQGEHIWIFLGENTGVNPD